MKFRIVFILMLCCVFAAAGILIAGVAGGFNTKPDAVEINRISVALESAEDFSDFHIESKYDFVLVSVPGGKVLFETKASQNIPLDVRISQAIAGYNAVIDYKQDGEIKGKIIIYTGQALQDGRSLRLTIIIVSCFILCILLTLFYFYMRFYLYRPFKRLKRFALDISSGNLELPLPMDKDNLFGEFTESFDIMREELKAARQKAVDEEKSKKELIASLSHDIKTPIAIVRAASELLEMNETNVKKLANIKAIQAKTSEIDALITDLFSSALEDLSELKIDIKNIESVQIGTLISNADTLKQVRFISNIPECLIKADPLRLSQVFGNILSNSYKYAGTEIEVTSAVADGFLKISFKDSGTSLDKEDLPLITNRFYRGKNAEGKQGAGLGLYICSKLLERMGGCLDFGLEKDGFCAYVSLELS